MFRLTDAQLNSRELTATDRPMTAGKPHQRLSQARGKAIARQAHRSPNCRRYFRNTAKYLLQKCWLTNLKMIANIGNNRSTGLPPPALNTSAGLIADPTGASTG